VQRHRRPHDLEPLPVIADVADLRLLGRPGDVHERARPRTTPVPGVARTLVIPALAKRASSGESARR
jgi:hypothetical protein